ncbi:MAG: SMI1/KNR4 family protein [Phycisphaeraceae bacterium]|nr:SMI1/KNR4 family protein [Phycisphaeraceae bacterium]
MPFPIARDEIGKTEVQLGLTFPPRFIDRMMRDNGGTVQAAGDSWELHPFRNGADRKMLARTANHVARETIQCREWPEFPPQGVVIASNGTGDALILLPSEVDAKALGETIYLWEHDTGIVSPVLDSIDSTSLA